MIEKYERRLYNMQNAILGMRTINVTQGNYAWIPSKNYFSKNASHMGFNAIDLAGEDVGADVWRAKNRWKVTAIHLKSSTGFNNTIMFSPCDDTGVLCEVNTPSGIKKLTLALTHINLRDIKVKVGDIVSGDFFMYMEGQTGKVANHIHAEVCFDFVTKKTNLKGSQYWHGSAWVLPNAVPLHEALFLLKDYNVIKQSGGYDWQWVDKIEGEENMSNEIVTRIDLNDREYEYRLSLDSNKFGTNFDKTTMQYFSDKQLEEEGWEKYLAVNGSVFYDYEGKNYAEGLEKSRGVNNQPFDMTCVSKFNDTMACGFTQEGKIVFDKQSQIMIDIDKYYGACTSMFGIMKDGQLCEWGREIENQRNRMYSAISGRTVIGYDSINNQVIFITIKGETGKSGAYGKELYGICKKHGVTDAMCMDGGGSVFLIHDNKNIVSTMRPVKNAILVYRRKKKVEIKTIGTLNVQSIGLNIRDDVMGKKIGFIPIGSNVPVIDFVDGIKKDGYQWVKVLYNDVERYAQYDSKCYWVKIGGK